MKIHIALCAEVSKHQGKTTLTVELGYGIVEEARKKHSQMEVISYMVIMPDHSALRTVN